MDWDFSPPEPDVLSDHDVFLLSDKLKEKNIALLVSGGIAALKSPLLARELRRHGANVTVYVSEEALRYTTLDTLEWSSNNKVVSGLTADAEHLRANDIFDCYLIAPATYNTVNKIATGIADNAITTTMASAIGNLERGKTRVIIVPTMHGDMHNSIFTQNMNLLRDLGVSFIKPRQQFGKNNLPNIKSIVAHCIRKSCGERLKGKRVLVTAGNTPVKVDGIRRLTTIFKGRLGVEIAQELYLRGAQVDLLLSGSDIAVPEHINTHKARSYDDYREMCISLPEKKHYELAIFSAAVADFMPAKTMKGKIKSDSNFSKIDLIKTEKVIDSFQQKFRKTKIISFKFEMDVSRDELIDIAKNKVKAGHLAVVANRGEEQSAKGGQVAYIVSGDKSIQPIEDKKNIASALCDFIETV